LIELTLIRHGQAGSRQQYDQLSQTGIHQARLLAGYLAAQDFRPDQVISGALHRQRETCRIVLEELAARDVVWPEPVAAPEWNEFDLDLVNHHVAEALAKEDDEFARQFTELQQAVQTGQDGIHRKWTPADAQIIRAWVEHRFDLPIESWRGFQSRILGAASTLSPGAAKVAVFTSATPVGIWAGRALGLDTPRILRLAGAQYNTALSRFFLNGEEVLLSSFNETPHLAPGERTLR
jgi:broad specificity phosphatase PhoE